MKMIHQLVLAAYTLALGGVSVWAFSHGVDAGSDHHALVTAVAAISIAAWGHLLFHLLRGMLRLRLSNGWCPILTGSRSRGRPTTKHGPLTPLCPDSATTRS